MRGVRRLAGFMAFVAGLYPLLVAFGVASEWTLLQATPYSWWFDVQEIGLAGPARIGAELPMYGVMSQYRAADVRAQASLYCDFGEGTQFYSSQHYERDYYVDRFSRRKLRWTYSGALPLWPADCRVTLVRSVELRYGIRKYQEISTRPFRIEAGE